jgi:hypothetical protein
MKLLSVSFLLILLSCAFLLNRISESAEKATPIEQPKRAPSPPNQPASAGDIQRESTNEGDTSTKESVLQNKLAAEDAKYKRQSEDRQIEIQQRIADFTGLLVIVGALQFLITGIAIYIAIKSTKAAQQSAIAANRALKITRPYIFVSHAKLTGVDSAVPTDIRVQFRVENLGKGPAIIVEAKGNITHSLPVVDDFSNCTTLNPKVPIVKADTLTKKVIHGERPTPIQIDAIQKEELKIFCYGIISYKDILGNPYKTTFLWEYRFTLQRRYMITGPDEYNRRT